MIQFRTVLPPLDSHVKISHNDHILCIGSCFAEHIGGRLQEHKFHTLVNPFGILYNPVSVANTLGMLLHDGLYSEKDLVENAGLWHSFSHHGSFSHPDQSKALENINRLLSAGRNFINKASKLIITLGTANIFVHKKTQAVVANCHKLPGSEFDRQRLKIGQGGELLVGVISRLKEKLPQLEVILTVSPLRHLRDGLIENQRSKATLILDVEMICQEYGFAHYFPAYELLLDDLRDYRFYEADMTHPNHQAIDYIWNYFTEAYFGDETKSLCKKIEQIAVASLHRPFHPQSNEHQSFIKAQLNKIADLEKMYPALDFQQEKGIFTQQVTT